QLAPSVRPHRAKEGLLRGREQPSLDQQLAYELYDLGRLASPTTAESWAAFNGGDADISRLLGRRALVAANVTRRCPDRETNGRSGRSPNRPRVRSTRAGRAGRWRDSSPDRGSRVGRPPRPASERRPDRRSGEIPPSRRRPSRAAYGRRR